MCAESSFNQTFSETVSQRYAFVDHPFGVTTFTNLKVADPMSDFKLRADLIQRADCHRQKVSELRDGPSGRTFTDVRRD